MSNQINIIKAARDEIFSMSTPTNCTCVSGEHVSEVRQHNRYCKYRERWELFESIDDLLFDLQQEVK